MIHRIPLSIFNQFQGSDYRLWKKLIYTSLVFSLFCLCSDMAEDVHRRFLQERKKSIKADLIEARREKDDIIQYINQVFQEVLFPRYFLDYFNTYYLPIYIICQCVRHRNSMYLLLAW